MSNKSFKELYAQRWGEVRGGVMSEKNIFSIIDKWEELLGEPAQQLLNRWNVPIFVLDALRTQP